MTSPTAGPIGANLEETLGLETFGIDPLSLDQRDSSDESEDSDDGFEDFEDYDEDDDNDENNDEEDEDKEKEDGDEYCSCQTCSTQVIPAKPSGLHQSQNPAETKIDHSEKALAEQPKDGNDATRG